MSSSDPLSLLLGKKKSEAQKQPATKAQRSSLSDLADVSAVLGRAQATASPAPRPDFTATTSDFTTTTTCPPKLIEENEQNKLGKLSVFLDLDAPPPTTDSAVSFDGMCDGEKVVAIVPNCCMCVSNPFCEIRGRLLATNFRLKFQTPKGSLRQELRWMLETKYFDIPVGIVEEAKPEINQSSTGQTENKAKIQTKDLRSFEFIFTQEEHMQNTLDVIKSFGQPNNTTLLFALKHAEAVSVRKTMSQHEGWNFYDTSLDYARMGIVDTGGACPWQLRQINADYSLCSTYPSLLVFPKAVTDNELLIVAAFRKRGRLPAMSWCGGPGRNYASIWRCSQTTEGLISKKCPEDERLVSCIGKTSTRDLLVIDLRPWKTAWVNKAGGGGFESYPNVRLVFGDIDNVHCVRDAWRAMGAAVNNVVDGKVGSWLKDVAGSHWYDYMGAILNCARMIVCEVVDFNSSVMCHCSDGWDRTAQATSVSMLCLDSYYRTQSGFLKLIQKEWCAFGHRFRTRLALGEVPSSEYSPIFVQWLECVYQLWRQCPSKFEFTPTLLLRLTHDALSNRYGTFLCDNEKERNLKVKPCTLSLWAELLRPEEVQTWRNPDYVLDDKPIIPDVSQVNFTVWEAYWFRYHPRCVRVKKQLQKRSHQPMVVTSNIPIANEEEVVPESTANMDPLEAVSDDSLKTQDVVLCPPSPTKREPPTPVFFEDDDDDHDIFAKSK